MSDVRQGPPPEPSGGQDDGVPDLGLALTVVLVLLADVDGYLSDFRGDPADLRLRIDAVSGVLRRLGAE